jgi:hypothetical protein
MSDTLDNIKGYLEFGVKAMFPFDAETISAVTEARHYLERSGKGGTFGVEKLLTVEQRLQNRLDLFKVKIDGEHVCLDAFTIREAEIVGEQVPTLDGSMDNSLVRGFIVECGVTLHSHNRDVQDDVDVVEVGRFTSGLEAAKTVIEHLMLDHIRRAFESEGERLDWEERKREGEQVF